MSNKKIDKKEERIRTLEAEKNNLIIINQRLEEEIECLRNYPEELKHLKQMMSSLTDLVVVNFNAFSDSFNALRNYLHVTRTSSDNNGQTAASTITLSENVQPERVPMKNVPDNLERIDETQGSVELENDIEDKENLIALDTDNAVHRGKVRRRAKKDGGNSHKNLVKSQQNSLDKMSITSVVRENASGKKKGSKKPKSKALDVETGKSVKQNIRKNPQRL